MTTFELIAAAILVHLVIDWFLQNDWQATNKMRWVKGGRFTYPHPAGLVHAGLHTIGMLLLLPVLPAILIGVTHWIIDLRVPLQKWREVARQTTDPSNPASLHVAMWQDQIAHVCMIVLVVLLLM